MITARRARLPKVRTALGTRAEVIRAQLIDAGQAEPQFRRESCGTKVARSQLGKKMAD